ncbi:MAG: C39 family peptidase [Lachnospiraceae bacterium]
MKKIISVPYIDQTEKWVYGCESISTVMLLQYLEFEIDPDTFIDTYLPRANSSEIDGVMYAEDPTYYYDLTGWGCYAPCIVNAITAVLADSDLLDAYEVTNETGKTAKELCAEYIDHDMPVIFWATLDLMPIPEENLNHWILPNGRDFTWIGNEHCLLLVGYDDDNYYFNDPWHNHGCCPYPKELVEKRHKEQGMYAVSLKTK